MRTNILFAAIDHVPDPLRAFAVRRTAEFVGLALVVGTSLLAIALATWSVQDPSFNHATQGTVRNLLGGPGAIVADLIMQMLGLSSVAFLAPLTFWGWRLLTSRRLERLKLRLVLWALGGLAAAGFASLLPVTTRWPLPTGLGGVVGDAMLVLPHKLFTGAGLVVIAIFFAGFAVLALSASVKLNAHESFDTDDDEDEYMEPRPRARTLPDDEDAGGEPGLGLISLGALIHAGLAFKAALKRLLRSRKAVTARGPAPWQGAKDAAFSDSLDEVPWPEERVEPRFDSLPFDASTYAPPSARAARQTVEYDDEEQDAGPSRVRPGAAPLKSGQRIAKEAQPSLLDRLAPSNYQLPPLLILSEAKKQPASAGKLSEEALEQNARLLEGVLDDFGVKGEIINVRPGPVVTLYELEPAPGIKSSRVIGLADDIARSMSAVSARVAVVQGRNAIGIELPNQRRETVYLARTARQRRFREDQAPPRHRARQDYRRRADHRRSRANAASSRRGHDGLRQIGRDQYDDLVAALPAAADQNAGSSWSIRKCWNCRSMTAFRIC